MELGLDPHATYLLFLGRLNLVKGPDLAVEALTLIDDANLLVVGDGPMEESLKQRAARLGLGERVLFLGQRPHQEVPRYLAACDLLVLPSRSEGQPNAVLEALAAERPVVAAAVGGVPEIVAEGRQGMLFPRGAGRPGRGGAAGPGISLGQPRPGRTAGPAFLEDQRRQAAGGPGRGGPRS